MTHITYLTLTSKDVTAGSLLHPTTIWLYKEKCNAIRIDYSAEVANVTTAVYGNKITSLLMGNPSMSSSH